MSEKASRFLNPLAPFLTILMILFFSALARDENFHVLCMRNASLSVL